jgi:hypothetical protein
MPLRETSRQRTSRIPLDYFKRRDALARWKLWLSLAAALFVGAWLTGFAWDSRAWTLRAERSRVLASHGPLTRAHAIWDAECDACHVPFKPINGSAWTSRYVANSRASDARCQACHAASPHHANAMAPDAENSCASCHADHRGRDASLVTLDDPQCTRCHASLTAHLVPGYRASIAPQLSQFDAAHHPEFELFRTGAARDLGTVKFNHALHLAKGLTLVPNGLPLKRVADLHEADRAFYRTRGEDDSAGIQLRCDACHVSDRGPLTPGSEPSRRGRGAYMLPIRYETQCRACHPLDYDPALPAIRHGLQPSQLEETLRQAYADRFVAGKPGFTAGRAVPSPIPGRLDSPELVAAREAISKDVTKAQRILLGEKKCGECHTIEVSDAGKPRIAKAGIPEVWLPRAAFDHSAHRAIGCRECHAQATTSLRSADVMIPPSAVCISCHAPRMENGGEVAGGAGFACVECHKYHDGPTALPRPGKFPLDPSIDSSIRQFLLGTPAAKGR